MKRDVRQKRRSNSLSGARYAAEDVERFISWAEWESRVIDKKQRPSSISYAFFSSNEQAASPGNY